MPGPRRRARRLDRGREPRRRSSAAAPAAATAAHARACPSSTRGPPLARPVTPQELAAITDVYLDLLRQTRYFDFVDERVVGWPESDAQQRYWYGHWWTGAGFEKTGGQVNLVHVDCGADNAGIPSSAVLEGVCLAHLAWPTAKLEHVVRKLVRGFNAWILAMQRYADDPAGVLLARVSYPESITSTDGGRTLLHRLQRRPTRHRQLHPLRAPAHEPVLGRHLHQEQPLQGRHRPHAAGHRHARGLRRRLRRGDAGGHRRDEGQLRAPGRAASRTTAGPSPRSTRASTS